MFPDPAEGLQVFRAQAPMFMRCPQDHLLPNRTVYGRCSPVDCAKWGEPGTVNYTMRNSLDEAAGQRAEERAAKQLEPWRAEMDLMPRGMEQDALKRQAGDPAEAERVMAQAAEALEMMRRIGTMAARAAIHPLPEVPPPPDLKKLGPKEYVKQRLQDVAPLALERKILAMRFDPGPKGDAAAEDILDRAGYGRKPEVKEHPRSPVQISLSVGQQLPYDLQGKPQVVDASSPPRVLSERATTEAAPKKSETTDAANAEQDAANSLAFYSLYPWPEEGR